MNNNEHDRLETYADDAFQSLRTVLPKWRDPSWPHKLRSSPRIFYGQVHSWKSSGIPSGHTSVLDSRDLGTYINAKGKEVPDRKVSDHFLSPQSVGEFVLDNPNPYLEDFELFKKLFKCSASTHEIKKSENDAVSDLKHFVPTVMKYYVEKIELYDKKTREPVSNWLIPIEHVSDNFYVDYCNWEKKFVLHEESSFGESLPEGVLIAQKSFTKSSLSEFF